MKKLLVFSALIGAAVIVTPLYASGDGLLGQAPSGGNEPALAISINPFATLIPLIAGAIGVEGSFEMRLTKQISLYIPVEFLSWPTAIYGWGWTYLSIGGEAHYYFADTSFNFGESDALRGLWAGAGLNIQFWTYSWSSYYTGLGYDNWTETVFTIPIHVGYKYVFGGKAKGFFFEPYLGYRIGFSTSTSPYGDTYNTDYSGFEYGGNIGFAF